MKKPRSILTKSFVLTIAVSLIGLATPASATLFFSDLFAYPNGELTINDGTGDDVSGGLWVPHSGEGFDDNLIVSNHRLVIRNSGSEDAHRDAVGTMGAGDTWYYGVQFQVVDTRSDPNSESINNDYFAHFYDETFGYRGRAYLDDPNVADPSKYSIGLSASSGGQAAKWATDLEFGAIYLMIVSYDYDTGQADLWINPADSGSTSIADTAGQEEPISALAFRQDFIGGTPNNMIYVNVAAIGDDFDSVLAAVVPEPSALALGGFGLLGLLLARRRA